VYTLGDTRPPVPSTISSFSPATQEEVRVILGRAPSKQCELDPLPTWLIKEHSDVMVPMMTDIINLSLRTGIVPSQLKQALVRPLLKKPSLDPEELNNYRPVSNLPFVSKQLERVVAARLAAHVEANDLHEPFQSAFKAKHSTETALIRVNNDILRAMDDGKVGILVLLDLSSAFDTVDHESLLGRLQHHVGLTGTALSWFRSYLDDRSQRVTVRGDASADSKLRFGVPQGSVLGPPLFSLYAAPLGRIIRSHGLQYHFFADDSQLYLFIEPIQDQLDDAVDRIHRCVNEIRAWLKAHFLKCNDGKTEVLLIGSQHQVCKVTLTAVPIGDTPVVPAKTVRNLGGTFDTHMSMQPHVNAVCRSARFHLRNIGKIRRFLTRKACEQVVHALVTCRLDINNALLSGLPAYLLAKLQRCQNVAARIVTCQKRTCHITPVLRELHWLPVTYRIQFKVLLQVYRALNGLAPVYMSDMLEPYVPARTLRSGDLHLLCVPRTYRSWGDRAFSKAGPELWNNLPLAVRTSASLNIFKARVKTIFFTQAFNAP
jgi:hypothetical protein